MMTERKKERIMIVEDDQDIREIITLYLDRDGYEVVVTDNGEQALELAGEKDLSLIILDILLPGLNGLEICRELRKFTAVPIIFVSCKGEEIDKIVGLESGADDYLVKPFSPRELVARVRANLRRMREISNGLASQQTLKFPGLEIDLNNNMVHREGKPVYLSGKEYKILVYLAQNPSRSFSLEELFNVIWQTPSLGDPRTVLVHISNLRKKIEADPSNPVYIHTIRGVGYKFGV